MNAKEFLKSKGITKATCYTDSNRNYYVDGLSELMEEYAKQQSIQFGRWILKHAETHCDSEGNFCYKWGEKEMNTLDLYEVFYPPKH